MLPDFEMIVHKFPAREDITIIPIADVHLGARECMEQEFIKFINSIAEKPNVYVVLVGDLLNNAIKSSVSNIYDEVYRPSEAKRMMAKILEPIKNRVLCSVTGNHERRSSREVDDDATADIMCKLDLEHLHRENIAFMKIQMGAQKNSNGKRADGDKRPCYTIAVTHGAGGGVLTGAGINRNERFSYAIDNLDCFISAHTHKAATTQPGKIVIDTHNNQIKVKPFKVITATSWLNTGGYSLQKMLLPSSHALQTITLCGDHKEMIVTM